MRDSDIGIVICSRTDSSRLPGKPFLKVGGKTVLAHLLDRLKETGMPIIVAVPEEEEALYNEQLATYIKNPAIDVRVFAGSKNDPLLRTFMAAEYHDLDHVVRVTHDKIFLDYRQIDQFVATYLDRRLDYIYSTNFIPGMGFEIFSMEALAAASRRFKAVEHISYAVEEVVAADRKLDLRAFDFSRTWLERTKPRLALRLLIDYPDDLKFCEALLNTLGPFCGIKEIVGFLPDKRRRNSSPDVSVYTCCYNDWEYLERAAASVAAQSHQNFEYIIVDDASKGPAPLHVQMQAAVYRNVKNIGLASSSNYAIDQARGRFVIRLDADDFFVNEKVVERMARKMESDNLDALYPYFIQDGTTHLASVAHHVGGAMFRKRALDRLRFTDGLRHFEGQDLYRRAVQAGLRIGYFTEATFYYRQRSDSMSKDPSPERREVARRLALGLTGTALL